MESLKFGDCVTGNFWEECLFFDGLSERYGFQRYRKVGSSLVELDVEYEATCLDYILTIVKVIFCLTIIYPAIAFIGKIFSRKCTHEKLIIAPPLGDREYLQADIKRVALTESYLVSLISWMDVDRIKGYEFTREIQLDLEMQINALKKDFTEYLLLPKTESKKATWTFKMISPFVVQLSLGHSQLVRGLPNEFVVSMFKAALFKEFPHSVWGFDAKEPCLYLKGIEKGPFKGKHLLCDVEEISIQTFHGIMSLSRNCLKLKSARIAF